jgi:hypothetical protein
MSRNKITKEQILQIDNTVFDLRKSGLTYRQIISYFKMVVFKQKFEEKHYGKQITK